MSHAFVRDDITRRLSVDVDAGHVLCTAKGARPIEPRHVQAEYWLDAKTSLVRSISISVSGRALGDWERARSHRARGTYVIRSYHLSAPDGRRDMTVLDLLELPQWLAGLLTEHWPHLRIEGGL